MDKKSFIEGVRACVRDVAVEGMYSNAANPPGRRPSRRELEIAEWIRGLSARDAKNIRYLIQESVDEAVFGFLCVLDGVRKVTDEEGELILEFKSASSCVRLNDFDSEDLHDIFNEE